VTLNPATYSGLEQDIGGIAPGRCADFAMIDDLETCHVREVLVDGKLAAHRGVSEVRTDAMALPAEMMHSLRVGLTISAETFRIVAPGVAPKVRVMELVNQTITAETVVPFNSPSNIVEASLYDDILKVAMFDRHHGSTTGCLRFSQRIRCKSGCNRFDDQSR
jgi:adenine deaminase